jgi:hypothetical protein
MSLDNLKNRFNALENKTVENTDLELALAKINAYETFIEDINRAVTRLESRISTTDIPKYCKFQMWVPADAATTIKQLYKSETLTTVVADLERAINKRPAKIILGNALIEMIIERYQSQPTKNLQLPKLLIEDKKKMEAIAKDTHLPWPVILAWYFRNHFSD